MDLLDCTEQKIKEPSSDWWGFKSGFVSGGLLGAKSGKKKSLKTERRMFCEDDQENLYNMVQVCMFVSSCPVLQACLRKEVGI